MVKASNLLVGSSLGLQVTKHDLMFDLNVLKLVDFGFKVVGRVYNRDSLDPPAERRGMRDGGLYSGELEPELSAFLKDRAFSQRHADTEPES